MASFNNTLCIYSKKAAIATLNYARMRDLRAPVYIIKASYKGYNAHTADTAEASNLPTELPLCLSARVMLTENL